MMSQLKGFNPEVGPLISVIIPVFNSEKTISRAIRSVLSQTYQNVEIVVVDDFSTDGTLRAIEPYLNDIVLVRHRENLNGAVARNNGVKASRGQFLAFLDSDDSYLPKKLEVQLAEIMLLSEKLGENVAVACGEVGGSKARGAVEVSPLAIFKKEYSFNTSSILITRGFFQSIGGFDESFLRHQDLELFVRLAKEGYLFYASVPPLLKREFSGSPSLSSTKSGVQAFWIKFESDINSLPFSQRRLVRALGFRRLAELAFNEKKAGEFFHYFFKAVFLAPGLIFGKIPYYIARAAKSIFRKGT